MQRQETDRIPVIGTLFYGALQITPYSSVIGILRECFYLKCKTFFFMGNLQAHFSVYVTPKIGDFNVETITPFISTTWD